MDTWKLLPVSGDAFCMYHREQMLDHRGECQECNPEQFIPEDHLPDIYLEVFGG